MRRALAWLAGTPVALFLLLPLLAPLAEAVDWDAALRDGPLRAALGAGLATAAAAAALALLLGAPAAFGLWHADPPARAALVAVLSLPLLLPPPVWAAALQTLPFESCAPAGPRADGRAVVAGVGWLALRRVEPGLLRAPRRRWGSRRASSGGGCFCRGRCLGWGRGRSSAAALSLGESVLGPALAAPGRHALPRAILDALREGQAAQAAAAGGALLALLGLLLLAAFRLWRVARPPP